MGPWHHRERRAARSPARELGALREQAEDAASEQTACLEQGEQVKLREGSNQWKDYGYGDVRCPVCLFDGWKKF